MAADAYVMDADLKAVADAIRKKSGKSGLLRFPSDFVKEISYMGPYAPPTIYGVRIDRNNPDPYAAVEYIDSSAGFTSMTRSSTGSWTDNPLISGIKPVMRRADGTWQDLNKRNLSSGADITAIGNDVFTEIPTWYLSITTDGTYDYVRFSDTKIDKTYHRLASMYNGTDKGVLRIGCYHAYNEGNKLYSSADKAPAVNISTEESFQYAQARGTGYDQMGIHQWTYLQALFLVLFKGRDAQALIGSGYTTPSHTVPAIENRTTYDNDYGMAGSASTEEQMSFFWINNWFGNVRDLVGGAKTDSNRKLMTLDNGEPINTDGSGWVTHDTTPGQYAGGLTTRMDMQSTATAFFPVKTENLPFDQYWCDYGGVNPDSYPRYGGHFRDGVPSGPFNVYFNNSPTTRKNYMGTRIIYRESA